MRYGCSIHHHRPCQLCSWLGRRGAAFGLAGVVKGLGIAALRGYGVLDALRAGVEDKSSADVREGALFAFQALVEKLGRMFEPYVVQVLLLGNLHHHTKQPHAHITTYSYKRPDHVFSVPSPWQLHALSPS